MTGMAGTRPRSEERRCPPRRTCSSPRSRPRCAPSRTARAKGFPRPGRRWSGVRRAPTRTGWRSARPRRGIVETRHRATAMVADRVAPPVAARGDGSRRPCVDRARRRRRLPPDRGRRAAPRRRRRADPDVARARRGRSRRRSLIPHAPRQLRRRTSAATRSRPRSAPGDRVGRRRARRRSGRAGAHRARALRRSLAIAAGERE